MTQARFNMLEQFYKYIVKTLMISYFKRVANKKGDRYYIIMDDKVSNGTQPIEMFNKALSEISEEITISGIFPVEQNSIHEDTYCTRVIKLPQPYASIIIGNDRDATEDYLVTMRNNIGEPGCKYEDFAALFILSEKPHDSSNPLSSICTTCTDLKSSGKPLSVDYVVKDIKSREYLAFNRDHERIYFDEYLNNICKHIEDGTNSLYDLMPALSALQVGSIKDLFIELGFFPDNVVIDLQNHLSDKDIKERAEHNYDIFQKVSDIMSIEEEVDKVELLQKILDEKLAKRISCFENNDWHKIDFQEILDSISRKNNSDDLELISVSLSANDLFSTLYHQIIGKRKYKRTVHAIVCNRSKSENVLLELQFNKNVLQKYLNDDNEIISHGKKVYISIPKTFTKMHSIGKNDNHHDVFALYIPCSATFFEHVKDIFSITKKGEILISTSPEQDKIEFGNSEYQESIIANTTIIYDAQKMYYVDLNENSEDDYDIPFKFNFDGIIIDFIIKVKASINNIANPIDYPDKRDRYCKWEDEIIKNKATRLIIEKNDFQNSESIIPQNDPIEEDIVTALNKIYDYYSSQKAGPTLLPFDDNARLLFENYLDVVMHCLEEIKVGDSLPKEKYYITKLGIIEYDDKIYFSSFHPLMVAYLLEYDNQRDSTESEYDASELLTPFYLAPFIRYNDIPMRPYSENGLKNYKNWLCYEKASNRPQDRAHDITARMVCSKMQEFIRHFDYLFQNLNCPIIISTIGIEDDRNVIKGILQFIIKEYKRGIQKIEIHEYISNLMNETFFERLNRISSTDLILKEIEGLGEKLEIKGEFTSQDILYLLFTRVVLYKHLLNDKISYCHIAFYQMNTGTNFKRYSMNYLRGELAFNGLVSIPSTINKDNRYLIGFGMQGVDANISKLHKISSQINNLYANEDNSGTGAYQADVCLVKDHEFNKFDLINSIYNNANWVTFLNPEVDINFFYKQDLYVIHYTDQYSINAKYDSITVTKQINQYTNLLKRAYMQFNLHPDKFESFNKVMAQYFNCLNGNWLLNYVNKTEDQVNEKMSLVAASIVMQRFMSRNKGVIWIPISLEEILRVTGSIGLPRHYIFTKEDIGATGSMTDDLLMIGLDSNDSNNIRMYLYPIEVKYSKNTSYSDKGLSQVCHTYQQIREHILGDENFTKKVFRTFFASQFLVNAEKLHANNLLNNSDYAIIEKYRYRLLNLKYTINEELPVAELGNAALVSFYSQAPHSIRTSTIEDVNICEIHFSAKECFEVVADPTSPSVDFLTDDPIEFNCDNNKPEFTQSIADLTESNIEQFKDDNTKHVNTDITTIIQETTNNTTSTKEYNESINDKNNLIQGIKITLGTTANTHREIIFEPNNTRIVSHPNMGIIGTMGTGKTQFARSIITQLSRSSSFNIGCIPIGILIFDYKGDYKDSDFLQRCNGKSYKSNFPFNPLKLIITPDLDGVNLPAVTADRISDSFAKAYGLGLKQQGNIKQIIIETYSDFGITRDPTTWNRPVPTMENIIDKYFTTFDANDKAYLLFDKLRDYTIFTSNNDSCVSIFEWLNCVRVIDLTIYPDDTKKVIVSLILDLFYAEMKQLGSSKQENGYRQLRSFIMVDEAHQFLKKDFNALRSIISEGREFGVGMILSTQNLNDFRSTNENYSQFILSWVIHHVNSVSKSEIMNIFGATDPYIELYMDMINTAGYFESVCNIGNNINAMRDLPYFELIKKE